MQHKICGPDATCVPALGLGCARVGSFNNPSSHRETMRLLERALELGISLFDTADIYGQGDSERSIGRLLKGRREAGFIVTKVGNTFSRKMRLAAPLKPFLKPILSRVAVGRSGMTTMRRGSLATDFSPKYIRSALEASLRRLQVDYVDVLLLHGPSVAEIDNPNIAKILQAMQDTGVVGAFGVACEDEHNLAAALRMPGLRVLELSPALLAILQNDPTFSTRGIAVILREAIRNRGHLTILEAITGYISRDIVTCVVVGTTSCVHLEEVAGAMTTARRDRLLRDDNVPNVISL